MLTSAIGWGYSERVSRAVDITELGRAFRAERERLALSQAYVADQIGVTQPTVCQFEGGRHGLSFERLNKLANVLDRDLAWFLGRAKRMRKGRSKRS